VRDVGKFVLGLQAFDGGSYRMLTVVVGCSEPRSANRPGVFFRET
jgi:hypothetical protein